jgi:hypothetical protein
MITLFMSLKYLIDIVSQKLGYYSGFLKLCYYLDINKPHQENLSDLIVVFR